MPPRARAGRRRRSRSPSAAAPAGRSLALQLQRALAKQESAAIRRGLRFFRTGATRLFRAEAGNWWRSVENAFLAWMSVGLLAVALLGSWLWKEDGSAHEHALTARFRHSLRTWLARDASLKAVSRVAALWLGAFFVAGWSALRLHWSGFVAVGAGVLEVFAPSATRELRECVSELVGWRGRTERRRRRLAVIELTLGLALLAWWCGCSLPEHRRLPSDTASAATASVPRFDVQRLREAAAGSQLPVFVPQVEHAYVASVYDGDTLTVVAEMPQAEGPAQPFKFPGAGLRQFCCQLLCQLWGRALLGSDALLPAVRLRGIDCAEKRGKTESEKQAALLARDALREKVDGQVVRLDTATLATDKYGRLLADVFTLDGLSLRDFMLENRFAVVYDGGTKAVPRDWLRFLESGEI